MVYITGDTHREFDRIEEFCDEYETSEDDILIILGDAGINYFLNESDDEIKEELAKFPITLFCIHGNHEERPNLINTYVEKNGMEALYFTRKNTLIYYLQLMARYMTLMAKRLL